MLSCMVCRQADVRKRCRSGQAQPFRQQEARHRRSLRKLPSPAKTKGEGSVRTAALPCQAAVTGKANERKPPPLASEMLLTPAQSKLCL